MIALKVSSLTVTLLHQILTIPQQPASPVTSPSAILGIYPFREYMGIFTGMSLDYRYYKVWAFPALDKDVFVESSSSDACCALPIWKDVSYVLYIILPGVDYGGFHHYLSVCNLIFNRVSCITEMITLSLNCL